MMKMALEERYFIRWIYVENRFSGYMYSKRCQQWGTCNIISNKM